MSSVCNFEMSGHVLAIAMLGIVLLMWLYGAV